MGKETKIGLAVIGVLVTVFSVLLFRQFGGRTAAPEVARAPIQPLSSAGMSKDVVVTSKDAGGLSAKLWDAPVASGNERGGQAPAASYMPAENEPASTSDPYAESNPAPPAKLPLEPGAEPGTESAAVADEPAPAKHNPFQSGAVSAAAEAVDAAAQEIPDAEPVARQGRNPLRRLSAELPLDTPPDAATEAPAAIEPAMTLPPADEPATADPYPAEPAGDPAATEQPSAAFDETPVEQDLAPAAGPAETSAAHRDPFDAAPKAQLAPSDGSFEPEPEVQAEVDAMTGPHTPADPIHAPLGETRDVVEPAPVARPQASEFDKFEQPAATRAPAARPAADDWQPSEAAAAPLAADVPQAAPLPVENGMYTVQPGDTLWSISEKVYGTGGYFKALGARNRSSLPRSDKLTVGTQLAVPPTAELERDFASLCPKPRKSALVRPRSTPPASTQRRSGSDVYIVNEGDTLFDIARYELGKASRWAEIYDLNRDVLGEDFDYLRPGTELVMPARPQAAVKPSESRYE